MSIDTGSGNIPQSFTTLGVPPQALIQAQGSQVVNGQVQDSSSSGSGSSPKVFTSLPNAPSLAPPNQSLLNQTPVLLSSAELLVAGGGGGGGPNELELNKAYDAAFEKLIAGKPNADQLRTAHYLSPPGTPMTAAEKQAFEMVVVQFGLSSQEFNPTPVKDTFLADLNYSRDELFEESLHNVKPPLTQDEMAKLRYMHFNPGVKFPGSDNPRLQSTFKQLEEAATKTITGQFNIPASAGITLKADTNMYNAMLNGFYEKFLGDNLTKYLNSDKGASLSDADKILLAQSIKDPTITVPASLAAAVANIRGNAINQVINTQGLEGIGFTPAAPGTFPPLNPLFKNFIATFSDIINQATNIVNAMPPGLMRTTYMNILKEVTAAIDAFQRAVYSAQGTTSEKARENSLAKLDIALNKIAEQAAKAKEAAKQLDKIKSMGVFAQIFIVIVLVILAIIAAITTVVSFGGAGPMMAALFAGVVGAVSGVMSAVSGGAAVSTAAVTTVASNAAVAAAVNATTTAVTEAATQAATTAAAQAIAQGLGEAAAKAAAEAAAQAVTAAAAKAAAEAGAKGLSDAAIQAAAEAAAKAMAEALAKGLSESAAQAAAQTAGQAAAQASSEVAAKIAAETAAEAVVKTVTEETSKNFLQQLLEKLTSETAKQAAKAVEKAGLFFQAGTDVVQGGMSIAQNNMQANLAILRANMESASTLADSEIAILKKLIDQLLALLAGQVETVQYISGVTTSITRKESQTINQIGAA